MFMRKELRKKLRELLRQERNESFLAKLGDLCDYYGTEVVAEEMINLERGK